MYVHARDIAFYLFISKLDRSMKLAKRLDRKLHLMQVRDLDRTRVAVLILLSVAIRVGCDNIKPQTVGNGFFDQANLQERSIFIST